MSLRYMISTALFAVIISIFSQFYVPIGSVPHTLQVMAVVLAGVILGPRYGALSVGIWILLGVFGLPVFTMGQAGPSVIIGPLGGFCIGFILQAAICGYAARQPGRIRPVLLFLVSLVVVYAVGIAGFMAAFTWLLHKSMTLGQAFMLCAAPFVPFDFIKLVLGVVLGKRISAALKQAGINMVEKQNSHA